MNDKEMSFADALKAEKERIGWSWPTMSKRIGVPLRTVENWKSGKDCPEYVKKYVLADLRSRG